jgi:hypothetical protein
VACGRLAHDVIAARQGLCVMKNNWTISVADGILERSGSLTDDVLLCDGRVRLKSSFGTNRPEDLPNVFRV